MGTIELPLPRKQAFICGHCKKLAKHVSITHGRSSKPVVKLRGQSVSFESYDLARCEECGNLTLCVHNNIHPGSMIGDPYETGTTYYPAAPVRTPPVWIKRLNARIKKILLEVYKAMDYRLFSIAAMGIRTIVDQMMMEKVGDVGTFKKKLDSLQRAGFIDLQENELLATLIDAGSASAHRGFRPVSKSVNQMMDITESILEKIYIIPVNRAILLRKGANLKEKIPARNKGAGRGQ